MNLEGRMNLLGEAIGTGDKSHLGGCSTSGDAGTYYPQMWEYLISKYRVKSVIDVGCGAGWSTKYFHEKDLRVLGVEGLQNAIDASPVKSLLICHDYESGPYVPQQKYDLCWSCEFVEHVEEKHAVNFIETFKNCKYVAMTFAEPGQGGHHHVNERPESYWVELLAQYGLEYDKEATEDLRKIACEDEASWEKAGSPWFAIFHFVTRGLLFVNREFQE